MANVLVVEDDRNLRRILAACLKERGHRVSESDNGANVLELTAQTDFDVLLLDLSLPGQSGIEVLRSVKAAGVPAEVIIVTGNAAVDDAIEAMKLGAYDYQAKPFYLEELAILVEKAREKKALAAENLLLKTHILRQSAPAGLVTISPVMRDVLEMAARFAISDSPVLLCGESGVGKELVARHIHNASPRRERPFVPVTSSALSETVLESELFGQEAGAFSGAEIRKTGLLEIADKGTLFFDEIGDMPPKLQVKLVRVLERGTFSRLGGTREITVDVKFLAATNRDLKRESERGQFRTDLYYRISALAIHVPPLRERKEDVPLLVKHFTKRTSAFRHKIFDDVALQVLSSYRWPGNVRELQTVIHRVLLLSPAAVIRKGDLPADLGGRRTADCRKLVDVEREHILKVLKETGGQKKKTAELLGVAPKTLYNKLQHYYFRHEN